MIQHQSLWQTDRFGKLSFFEQMANVGSEVCRAISWREKKNNDYSRQAFERALELLDLVIKFNSEKTKLKELARLREVLVDDFFGANSYHSTSTSWQNYFLAFNWAARRRI